MLKIKPFVLLTCACVLLSCGGEGDKHVDRANLHRLGSFEAIYDPLTGKVTFVDPEPAANTSGANTKLDYFSSTGALPCAILDKNNIRQCRGLVDVKSWGTNYDAATETLSFYAGMENISDTPEGPNFIYRNKKDYPPNSTFVGPFEFKLRGLESISKVKPYVTSVNTNFKEAECGANGLTLANDDKNNNFEFDCIDPDQPWKATDSTDPGWTFDHIAVQGPNGPEMKPGDDTNRGVFMQFTIRNNVATRIKFELLAVRVTANTPNAPRVTNIPPHMYYTNKNPLTVTGSCDNKHTVIVEGGFSTTPPSALCKNGAFSIAVPLFANQKHTLSVHQQDATKNRSGAVSLQVVHDSIPPTVTSATPQDFSFGFGLRDNCSVTFSEALDSTKITANNFALYTGNTVGSGTRIQGTILGSTDNTTFTYKVSNTLNKSQWYHCRVNNTVTDRAGNPMKQRWAARTYTSNQKDTTAPKILSMSPADNARQVPSYTHIVVKFSESIDQQTVAEQAIDNACSQTIPNITAFTMSECSHAGNSIIRGTSELLGDNKTLLFTPAEPLPDNSCIGFLVSACVKDTSQNKLTNRGSFFVKAHTDSIAYNQLHIFYTGNGSSKAPNLTHIGPMAKPAPGAKDVSQGVYPFMVFDQPLNIQTVIKSFFNLRQFGKHNDIAVDLQLDSSLQMVTLKPTRALALDKEHLATTTGEFFAWNGKSMKAPATGRFRTTKNTDFIPPILTSNAMVMLPGPPTQKHSRCSLIDFYFPEPMNERTFSKSNMLFNNTVNGWTDYSMQTFQGGRHVRLIPHVASGNLTAVYFFGNTIPLPTDRAGNPAWPNHHARFFFTKNDTTSPNVVEAIPMATGIAAKNHSQVFFFSERIDSSTIQASNFRHTACKNPAVFIDPIDGLYAVVNCPHFMNIDHQQLQISRNVRDYHNPNAGQSCESGMGNRLSSDLIFDFIVEDRVDTTAPRVLQTAPKNGTTKVPTTVSPNIMFNEAIDPRTVHESSVFLMNHQGDIIDSKLRIINEGTTVVIDPLPAYTGSLGNLPNNNYYIVVTNAVRDLGGNSFSGASKTPGILRSCFSTTANSCP